MRRLLRGPPTFMCALRLNPLEFLKSGHTQKHRAIPRTTHSSATSGRAVSLRKSGSLQPVGTSQPEGGPLPPSSSKEPEKSSSHRTCHLEWLSTMRPQTLLPPLHPPPASGPPKTTLPTAPCSWPSAPPPTPFSPATLLLTFHSPDLCSCEQSLTYAALIFKTQAPTHALNPVAPGPCQF